MSTFTIEVLESEEENFLKEISKLSYVNLIYNNEKKEILNSIELGLAEVKNIINGKSKAISEEEFFSNLS